MGIYQRYFLPHLIHKAMADKRLVPHREKTLSGCTGKVLELGVGAGANLPLYPSTTEVTGIDNNASMAKFIDPNQFPRIEFEFLTGSAENLPFSDASFDCVVSTFTLCSVNDPNAVISEAYRCLKPGGRFFFLEHGQCLCRGIQFLQSVLNKVHPHLTGGCQLTRNIAELIRNSSFKNLELETFFLDFVPKPYGFIYQGSAEK